MVAVARAVVCLSLWLSVCQVRGSYIPPKMNKTIQNLLQYYNITPKERFNGMPVFSREPLAGKLEAKRVFMGGVLEVYEKLIHHMLKQLPHPTTNPPVSISSGAARGGEEASGGDIKTELSYILKKVQELKKHRFQEQETLLQELKALRDIKMDNLVVQSKALWELPWLYEEASSLFDNVKTERRRRRRRRQARRAKTHPKA